MNSRRPRLRGRIDDPAEISQLAHDPRRAPLGLGLVCIEIRTRCSEPSFDRRQCSRRGYAVNADVPCPARQEPSLDFDICPGSPEGEHGVARDIGILAVFADAEVFPVVAEGECAVEGSRLEAQALALDAEAVAGGVGELLVLLRDVTHGLACLGTGDEEDRVAWLVGEDHAWDGEGGGGRARREGSSSAAQKGWVAGRESGAKAFMAHHGEPLEL